MPLPTSSCTVTRTSVSSTARPILKSSSTKRCALALKRSRSPTTTGSTALSASPPQHGRPDWHDRRFGVESADRQADGVADQVRSIPKPSISSCWPKGIRVMPGSRRRSGRHSSPGARRVVRSSRSRRSASRQRGEWFVLTGCRHGAVPRALEHEGPRAAARELQRLIEAFGRDSVLVELSDHGTPIDQARNDALAVLAVQAGVGYVATTNAHYASPVRHRLASTLGAIRARQPLRGGQGIPPGMGIGLASFRRQSSADASLATRG